MKRERKPEIPVPRSISMVWRLKRNDSILYTYVQCTLEVIAHFGLSFLLVIEASLNRERKKKTKKKRENSQMELMRTQTCLTYSHHILHTLSMNLLKIIFQTRKICFFFLFFIIRLFLSNAKLDSIYSISLWSHYRCVTWQKIGKRGVCKSIYVPFFHDWNDDDNNNHNLAYSSFKIRKEVNSFIYSLRWSTCTVHWMAFCVLPVSISYMTLVLRILLIASYTFHRKKKNRQLKSNLWKK